MTAIAPQTAPIGLAIVTGGTYTDVFLGRMTQASLPRQKPLTTRHDLARAMQS